MKLLKNMLGVTLNYLKNYNDTVLLILKTMMCIVLFGVTLDTLIHKKRIQIELN